MTTAVSDVYVSGEKLNVTTASGARSYDIRQMPEKFLRWQLDARLAMFDSIGREERISAFHAHLPVVATINDKREFPIHTATKATGLLPKDEYLTEYVESFNRCLEQVRDRPWEESQSDRIAVAKRLYANPDHVDARKLGLVEIFEGQTYRNLMQNPVMAVHYTGPGPEYLSYQLNGVVELVGPGDPRFEFPRLMRQLFEYNSFHIQQPAYPSGYLFWICEALNKTPRRRR
ncbi:MAG: hypothetical protein ACE5HT_04165 [Gemmatimonadales bacterium]